MTNSIGEIQGSKCILLIGSNTTSAHPVISLEIMRAVENGAKLIVINPMEISLVNNSYRWLQLNIGTDVALLNGIAKVIIDEDLADIKFVNSCCENFNEFKESLKGYSLNYVSSITGIAPDDIVEVARTYASIQPASIIYCLGITEHTHGTDNVLAIANLAMLTGNIGKPSTGVNPLRGQNNVQGACDMGCLPNTYTGYQQVNDPNLQKKFELLWAERLSPIPGLAMTEMLNLPDERKLKALYIIGENPVLSEPDITHVIAALKEIEFLIVEDIFLTETAQLAHVVLPAASFAEEDGTFTNTERRVQRVRKIIEPVGNSKPNWSIMCQIAKLMGAKGFDYSRPAEIMAEIAKVAPSYGGISYQRLDSCGLQWPCPIHDHPGTQILHMSRFTCGLGKFKPVRYRPPAESLDAEYPFILTTGRSLYHYHTGTMTRKITGLNVIESEDFMKINPRDASALKINDGEKVKILSRRGEKLTRARITRTVPTGVVYMDFHFAESPTNILTNNALDPIAKAPEFKVSAVKIEKSTDS